MKTKELVRLYWYHCQIKRMSSRSQRHQIL